MLRKRGYTVFATGSPDDALRLWRTRHEPVDLLLTDLVMPGMNGRELAERLTARSRPCGCSTCRATPTKPSFATAPSRPAPPFSRSRSRPPDLAAKVRETLDRRGARRRFGQAA